MYRHAGEGVNDRRLLDDDRAVHDLPAEHPIEVGERAGSTERPAEGAVVSVSEPGAPSSNVISIIRDC